MQQIKDFYIKHKEGINYLIVGGLTTLLTLFVYFILTITFLNPKKGIELQIANILSWIVGFLFAYYTNRKYVFESKNKEVFNEFTKFLASRISTLILDMLIMFIFVTLFKFNNQVMKLISQICVIVSNYILSKCLVFGDKKLDIKKISNYTFVVIVFLIFTIGFFSIFSDETTFCYLENKRRTLFSVPTKKTFDDGTYQNNLEKALSDNVTLSEDIKEFMLTKTNLINFDKIDKKICKNKYVALNSKYGIYNCEDYILETPINFYKKSKKTIKSNIQYYNKINGLADTYYYVITRANSYNFEKNKVSFDIYSYLNNHLEGDYTISQLPINSFDDFKKYFYKTDHHWNKDGSYKAYKDIYEMMDIDDELLVPKSVKTVDKYNFVGTASKSSKQINIQEKFEYYDFDIKEHYEYINGEKKNYGKYDINYDELGEYGNLYAYVYGDDYKEIVFDFDDDDKDNLLIIATSYSNPINRLIASHFNKTYVVDMRHWKDSTFDVSEYIKVNNIDKVLLLVSSDAISDSKAKIKGEL